MQNIPPEKPSRIDPRSPPSVRPPAPEPYVPEPPETPPLAPDFDRPDACPEEAPCPEQRSVL